MSVEDVPPPVLSLPLLAVGATTSLPVELLDALEVDGFEPVRALSGAHARSLARQRPPAVVLVGDVGSTRLALNLLAEIRHAPSARSPWDPSVPVMVLSERGGELDLLRAFEGGADDFLSHPLSYLELRARVRALLRRSAERDRRQRLCVGALAINTTTRAADVDGRALSLSRLEFDLLAHLAADPERVFTKQELLRDVWGFRAPGATRTLDSHASRLRRKLTGAGGRWVVNVWGVGYRLT